MEIPDTFKDVIITFINDLNITFPEYSIFWNKWINPDETEINKLFEFMMKVFPERMFDILTQNETIFTPDSSVNTVFLPNIEFKLLFNTNGITENNKQTIWKYLQLIMMTLMGSIKNKSQFGETAGLFESIDEGFLQEKLNESILKMGEFFDNIKSSPHEPPTDTPPSDIPPTDTPPSDTPLPNPEKMFEHLQSLFGGKIGNLAKEFAEEFSSDMKDILNEDDLKNANSVKDILPKLLKDPKKILSLVKSIHEKVNTKMDSGEISRDELMQETQDMMKKMQEMGGVDNFADMLKGMADKMGMGKNARIDKNAIKKMESNMKLREQMRKKLDIRKATNNIVKNENTGELNFVCGEEKQEKSYLEQNAEIDKIMDELNLNAKPNNKKSKKPKKTNK
jgi:hypothetical protein